MLSIPAAAKSNNTANAIKYGMIISTPCYKTTSTLNKDVHEYGKLTSSSLNCIKNSMYSS